MADEMVITDGLPEGWTFHKVEHGEYVTYEVRTAHRFLVMSSTYEARRSPPDAAVDPEEIPK